jgi:hypothetical protein
VQLGNVGKRFWQIAGCIDHTHHFNSLNVWLEENQPSLMPNVAPFEWRRWVTTARVGTGGHLICDRQDFLANAFCR